jgi:hypothetical protein
MNPMVPHVEKWRRLYNTNKNFNKKNKNMSIHHAKNIAEASRTMSIA